MESNSTASNGRQKSTAWRESIAYALPGIVGFCSLWLLFDDEEGAIVRLILAIVGGFVLQAGAMIALVIAEHTVQSVAGVEKIRPVLIDQRHALSAAAVLIIAVWSLGHYWVRQQEKYLLQCAREAEQYPRVLPNLMRKTPESVIDWCLERRAQSARQRSADD